MFISEAMAQTAEAANTVAQVPGNDWMKVVAQLVFLMFIFYFLLVRPQQKKVKEQHAMISGIIPGTKVLVNGIIGTAKHVRENGEIVVEIANGVEIIVLKDAITGIFKEEKAKKEGK